MTGEGNVYNFANTPMYLEVMGRIWPTILMIPIIIARALNTKNRSVSLMLICLIVIYVGGYFTKSYSYGRSIAFILILSNIFLAQCITNLECYLSKKYCHIYMASFDRFDTFNQCRDMAKTKFKPDSDYWK